MNAYELLKKSDHSLVHHYLKCEVSGIKTAAKKILEERDYNLTNFGEPGVCLAALEVLEVFGYYIGQGFYSQVHGEMFLKYVYLQDTEVMITFYVPARNLHCIEKLLTYPIEDIIRFPRL